MVVMHLKGIKKATAKGRVYWYHRATGKRIQAEFGTAEFAQEVATLDRSINAAAKFLVGSWGELVSAYKASPEFQDLAPVTKSDYNKILNFLAGIDGMPVSQMDTPFILGVRDDALVNIKGKRRWANYTIQVMSAVFKWAIPRGIALTNPASGVPQLKRPRGVLKRNRPWKDYEIEVFFNGNQTVPALTGSVRKGSALGLYAGCRIGDMVSMLLSVYDGHTLEWDQNKTGNPVFLRVHKQLKIELDKGLRNSVYLVSRLDGQPYTRDGFATLFFRRVRMLVKLGLVEKGLTFHGLRHTAGRMLAEAGCDTRDIAAVLGHKTEDMARKYAEGEDRSRRAKAAIVKLERNRK